LVGLGWFFKAERLSPISLLPTSIQIAGKAFFHQVFVIGKVCDHGIGEHMENFLEKGTIIGKNRRQL